MRPALVAIAASIAVAILAAGCGDEGSASATLTADEWRRQADAVCADIAPRVMKIPLHTEGEGVLHFTSGVIPLWKEEEDRIRALAAPPELAHVAESLADALADLNVSLLEIHIATQRGDDARRNEGLRRGEGAEEWFKSEALKLRLHACWAQRILR